MKNNKLRFLMNLHESIKEGCEILAVERAAFMPALDRFFETVSLGIEMGLKMKASSLAASSTAQKPSSKKPSSKKGKVTFVQRLVQVMGSKTMHAGEIEEALVRSGTAPVSKNLRAYVCSTLVAATDENGTRVFTSPERGLWAAGAVTKAQAATKAQAKPVDARGDRQRMLDIMQPVTPNSQPSRTPRSVGKAVKAKKKTAKKKAESMVGAKKKTAKTAAKTAAKKKTAKPAQTAKKAVVLNGGNAAHASLN